MGRLYTDLIMVVKDIVLLSHSSVMNVFKDVMNIVCSGFDNSIIFDLRNTDGRNICLKINEVLHLIKQ